MTPEAAWAEAAELSSRVHIRRVPRPFSPAGLPGPLRRPYPPGSQVSSRPSILMGGLYGKTMTVT